MRDVLFWILIGVCVVPGGLIAIAFYAIAIWAWFFDDQNVRCM